MKKKRIIRLFSLFLVLILVLSVFSACGGGKKTTEPETSTTAADSIFTAGSYTASAKGMNGDVSVSVTFTDISIVAVQIGDHSESEGISEPAIETIPASIVQHQSIGVDVVAGATLTSNAIIDAVADCITQAGANPEDFRTAVIVAKEDASMETDVLVVGGGIAGLMAANEAADVGANVILIEKMASLGGASITSGGEVYAAGTSLQKENGVEDTWEALAKKWIDAGEGHVNKEMLTAIAENLPADIEYMEENGVKFSLSTPTAKPWDDPKRTHVSDGGGAGLVTPLAASAETKGVTILTSSPATSLIVEDGAVVGINGTTATGGVLTIRAKKVILATGGFDGNPALMSDYLPTVQSLSSRVGEAHSGDGLLWAKELGSPIISNDSAIVLAINYFASCIVNYPKSAEESSS